MRKPIPKSVRKLVYEKYNGHCAYCGREIPEKVQFKEGKHEKQ